MRGGVEPREPGKNGNEIDAVSPWGRKYLKVSQKPGWKSYWKRSIRRRERHLAALSIDGDR